MAGESMETTGSTTSSTSVPGLDQILGWGQSIAESGSAWTPNTTSMVTPFSTQTSNALSDAESYATGSQAAFDQNWNNIFSAINNGGLSDLQQSSVAALQGIAGGNGMSAEQQKAYSALTPTANGLNTMQQQAADYLNPIASGSMMSGNPYLEDMIKKAGEDIRYQTGVAASGMGRYGSGGHEGVLADSIGDMSTDLRYQNYTDEAARKDAAIRDYFGMGSTGSAQRTGALGQQADLATTGQTQRTNALGQQFDMGTTGQTQKMDALGSLYNAGQQQYENTLGGTQALLDAYNANLAPYQTMLGIGQSYEGLNSQVLADQARIYDESQSAITDPLDWLKNLVNPYATTTTETAAPYDPVSASLGGGLSTYAATQDPLLALLGGLSGLKF